MVLTRECIEEGDCLGCPQISECVTRLCTFWGLIISQKQTKEVIGD